MVRKNGYSQWRAITRVRDVHVWVQHVEEVCLKDKVYYTPQEVAKALGIETYVLRYWETQFPFLNPERTKVGWRRYRKEDISKVILIKKLLYDEHFTIKGAKQRLSELKQDGQLDLDTAFEERRKKTVLDEIKKELEALLLLLEGVK